MRIQEVQSILLAALVSLSAPLSVDGAVGDLLWSEEFDYTGTPDPSIWSHDVGNNNGWGNNELQIYTSDSSNSIVQDGILRIMTRRNGNSNTFTSARIKTENKVSFTYGTLEARIQVPDMDAGLWPCFWTMGEDFYQVGWPKAGEVDIMEMGQGLAINEGLVNQRVVSAAHWDIFGQYATYAKSYDSPTDLSQDYHIYKLEWTPDSMTTYVDGNWIWEIDITDGQCPSCTELHQPHHILLNMAVGGGFTSGGTSSSAAGSSSSGCEGSSSAAGDASSGGCSSRGPDDITAPLPAELKVDWVRLYDNGYTTVNLPPTPVPTPVPTARDRLPATPNPTPLPTTPLPTPFPTPMPTNPIPVTYAPVPSPVTSVPLSPSNRFPYPVEPVTPQVPVSGGKGGKGGKKGSFSRSATSSGVSLGKGKGGLKGGSRSATATSFGKGGKGNLGAAGSRLGTSSKGKGRWSRSGATAGTQRTTADGTPLDTTTSTPPPTATPTQTPATPPPTPPMGSFGSGAGGTETDSDEDSPETSPGYSRGSGPQSVVAQSNAATSSANAVPFMFLSVALALTVTLGLIRS
ncbi:Glycosyl hydrolases family 16 [Seminavis robusta]|uniref:Glycosyl hydrolases family 16 n=1 Tax=Seminavis robusta TaxID=568900 RepID=A0A9N8HSN3_9STRA|nr:Glycosyl hydrolases family 16 [Seminavis robusta]|eukprot:Sro1185_g250220.1 Glycosyl hydrolases family 16 (573) ;mRNA; f:22130-23943